MLGVGRTFNNVSSWMIRSVLRFYGVGEVSYENKVRKVEDLRLKTRL